MRAAGLHLPAALLLLVLLTMAVANRGGVRDAAVAIPTEGFVNGGPDGYGKIGGNYRGGADGGGYGYSGQAGSAGGGGSCGYDDRSYNPLRAPCSPDHRLPPPCNHLPCP
uniref:Uncharacterized protein n=1 Tax=Oryza nivara TaxID=4536 RepID=A0A0E0IYW0_ORYNI